MLRNAAPWSRFGHSKYVALHHPRALQGFCTNGRRALQPISRSAQHLRDVDHLLRDVSNFAFDHRELARRAALPLP
jgi:hypothetical protein